MDNPLISVILPVWDEEENIERAMRSIMNQTYRNLEIIVIDDGSTDGTLEIARRVAKEDPRAQVVVYPNAGNEKKKNWRGYDINTGAMARNYGFAHARGEWITVQDADDFSLLNRIEVQYNVAKKYKATMVCVSWQQASKEAEGKKLDVELFLKDHGGEEKALIRPELINSLPRANLGPLMRLPFKLHRFIPFPFKWFPYTRALFYGKQIPFPGAGNCMLFNRVVLDSGINFRRRNDRQWGSPTGRGSDRDFLMRVTQTFKNTWTFKVPLYQWDVRSHNPDMPELSNYLI